MLMSTFIMLFSIWIVTLIFTLYTHCNAVRYSPDWKSLDSRPLPSWYDQAKIGIFIHWGVFSVPGFGDFTHAGEWFWWYWQGVNMTNYEKFMANNYPPSFTYASFAKEFRAERFDPDQWADLFNASGAKYVVLTSKHHEGFCNWNSKYSWNWNSVDIGPNMDLVEKLGTSIRNRTKLIFGLYHSLFEWFNPLYLTDKNNKFKTNLFVRDKTLPELYEIVKRYKPDVIWSDGDWEAIDAYWNSTEFLAWLYNDSPVKNTVVTNDRWGIDTACKHGGFYTCQDRYNPGKLVNHKWENCFTLDKYSWGFRKEMNAADVMSIEEIVSQIASTVSCGGNVLINIGPTGYGTIPSIFQERLLQLGNWLGVNGESIYNTKPWSHQNDTISKNVWYTSKTVVNTNYVYAIILKFPDDGKLKLGSIVFPVKSLKTEQIELLGFGKLSYQKQGNYTLITLPVNALLQLKWAWTLKISGMIY